MRELGADGPEASEGWEGTKSATSEEEEENERLKAFKAVWEAALLEGLAGDGADLESALGAATAGTAAEKEASGGGTYQDRLKQAMNKIKEGESKLQVSLYPFMTFLSNLFI